MAVRESYSHALEQGPLFAMTAEGGQRSSRRADDDTYTILVFADVKAGRKLCLGGEGGGGSVKTKVDFRPPAQPDLWPAQNA